MAIPLSAPVIASPTSDEIGVTPGFETDVLESVGIEVPLPEIELGRPERVMLTSGVFTETPLLVVPDVPVVPLVTAPLVPLVELATLPPSITPKLGDKSSKMSAGRRERSTLSSKESIFIGVFQNAGAEGFPPRLIVLPSEAYFCCGRNSCGKITRRVQTVMRSAAAEFVTSRMPSISRMAPISKPSRVIGR